MIRLCICLALLAASVAGATRKGYPGINCPLSPLFPAIVVIPCDSDCKNQHNAEKGFCGDASKEDYSCYCEKNKTTVSPLSQQCRPGIFECNFAKGCDLDCKCNHGSTGGTCDFKRYGCQCSGERPNESTCPYDSKDKYEKAILDLLNGIPCQM